METTTISIKIPKPQRSWLRFSLAGLLVFVSLVAVYLGIMVNRPNCRADVSVLMTGEGSDETMTISKELLIKALNRPSVRTLSSVRTRAKPEQWLSSRLSVKRPRGSQVVAISIRGNDYRDNPDDFRADPQ